MNSNIRMVQIVAEELEKLKEPFVFVGGAIASLYITDQAVVKVRATNDVDCVIQVATRADYYKIEQKLREHGFSNVPGKVICRWNIKGINVDIMPSRKEILGFANRWYKEGITNSIKVNLSGTHNIKILSLPYFIATKLEAFNDRGKSDFYGSHDLEDIISVLDGCESSEKEISKAIYFLGDGQVMQFLRVVGWLVTLLMYWSAVAGSPNFHFDPVQEELSGTLEIQTFPGLPNYHSIAEGDEAEEGFYLKLDRPIDVMATIKDINWETQKNVKVVQLILDDGNLKQLGNLRKGTHLLLKGRLSNWITGHHHARILLEVDHVQIVPKS